MHPSSHTKKDFPYWLVAIVLLTIAMWGRILTDELYTDVADKLVRGVGVTILVTLIGFTFASLIGLALAVATLSRFIVLRQLARLYIEIMRGIPILVLLLYIAFVVAPGLVYAWNWIAESLGFDPIRTRDFPLLWRAVMALTLAYSAFIAEVFRAGLLSVDPGQVEAAKALGLSGWYRFRHIIFPQAIRTIMPPMGNDFVAMIKDSSLVSVLGVYDITQIGKVTAAGNFRYFETYNVVALYYLMMTVTLSLLLGKVEQKMRAKYP
ncbi:amino acid ABC transporter permease [Cochlodiniinecator piscidefendens]|uniref:amino acid ABC transporter permease n=1 Tax=Cochlodiniinecator piscidefendens TaxID=2715756 RepID=UPI001409A587|nr:amino acid ABC transporter permease [Cochlodiniinecator piscidefendens]